MSISLIKLSYLKANDINLAANDYLHQSIALTAFAGFSHVIERWFNEQGCDLEFAAAAVMPIIHSVSKPVGFPKSMTYDSQSRDKAGAPRLLYQYEGNAEFSLIIAFVCEPIAITPYDILQSSTQRREFLSFINRQHFAGGMLMPVVQEQIHFYDENQSPHELISMLKADGYVLEDACALLETKSDEQEQDSLDRLLTLIARKTDRQSDTQGFYVPAAIGFHLLEQPDSNRIQRDPEQSYPHAFAEPMLGAIRLRSVGSYRKQYMNQEIPVWWQYQDRNNDLFIKAITTHELEQL